MNLYHKMLDFQEVTDRLKEHSVTERSKKMIEELSPILDERELRLRLRETSEARILLDNAGSPPLSPINGAGDLAAGAEKGELLSIDELEQIRQFVTLSARMKHYLKKNEDQQLKISEYGRGIFDLGILKEEIERCIRSGRIDDSASRELKEIRRKKEYLQNSIRTKLEGILRSKKAYMSESFISMRNGHYTLPVKREYKLQISGSVIDVSSSGNTCFIEPGAAAKSRQALEELEISESNEERKVLYALSDAVGSYRNEILLNQEYIEELDVVFAKGKLSASMNGTEPSINLKRSIRIVKGKHPLLDQRTCVPLDIELGAQTGTRGIIITGPNTGGKTVALKTVGLFSLMAQCGLHVPCEEADLAMNTGILCDIGDNQSILESLSTFSAHIKNVIRILSAVEPDTLVLMDELGSGTDPAEGMGIAAAILEELRRSNCNFMVTTHYPEIKEYARSTSGVQNAKMAFDRDSLKPLYSLEIGEAGESCALYIAKQLGMPEEMLRVAYEYAYPDYRKQEKTMNEQGYDFAGTAENRRVPRQPPKELYTQRTTIIPEVHKQKNNQDIHKAQFQMGDSVMVFPGKKTGLVFAPVNEKGEVGVQIQKKKIYVSHKRVKLLVAAKEMYPEDYDFSIVFDTVENRKTRHVMERKYVKDLEIRYDK